MNANGMINMIQRKYMVDSTIEAARVDIQEDYLRMAIESYLVNQDAAAAMQRWEALGSAGRDTLDRVLRIQVTRGWMRLLALETWWSLKIISPWTKLAMSFVLPVIPLHARCCEG